MTTDIAKQRDETDDENIMISGMFAVIAVIVAVVTVQRMVGMVRFPVQTEGIEPIASNVGMAWHQLTAAGRPNELRMIAENSTGAFERMLLGLTT